MEFSGTLSLIALETSVGLEMAFAELLMRVPMVLFEGVLGLDVT